MRRLSVLLGVPTVWLATMAWLTGPAAARFPAPPMAVERWGSWWESSDPLDAVCALARVGCILLGLGLFLLVVAAVAARIAGAQVWTRRIAAISPSVVSAFVAALVVSASPSAGADTVPVPFLPAVGPGEGATMTVVDTTPPPTTPPTTTPPTNIPPTTTPPPVITAPTRPPAAAAIPPRPEVALPATAASVVVAAGEHFWSIAEREVGQQLGRAPREAEVAGYWRRLVAANADRLVEPGNPDLLEVGQVILLP